MTTGHKIVLIADYIARPDWQFDKSVANTGLKLSLGILSKPWMVKKKNCIEYWLFLFKEKEPCTKNKQKNFPMFLKYKFLYNLWHFKKFWANLHRIFT